MTDSLNKIIHLYNRAGFGLHPLEQKRLKEASIEFAIERVFKNVKSPKPINYLPDPRNRKGDVGSFKTLKLILKSRQELRELNLAWLKRMAITDDVLREKMTLFWHDHFATNVAFAYLMQIQNNTLRELALGNFKNMLHAVSKDPAMIIYLNNQQNKKEQPNENFAREVLELFTIGPGNYSENDIKEAARAFTGWQVNGRGEFEFNESQHDFGDKHFMGESGNFNGNDILDIILKRKETAHFLCSKIYRYFVNETLDESDEAIIDALAISFYNDNYDIYNLMLTIFSSSWFYDDKNRASKIKSPAELLVGFIKLVNIKSPNKEAFLKVQESLGQILFFPPNVAGWPGGKYWIDSTSLLIRMKLPLAFFSGERLALSNKVTFEQAENTSPSKEELGLRMKANWKFVIQAFENVPDAMLAESIYCSLVFPSLAAVPEEFILSGTKGLKKEEAIKWMVINTMALPEFQLC
jgi:uncharacterized protein (DUF1800 family)